MNNEFEKEMKDYAVISDWVTANTDKLDVMETMVLLGAYKQFVDTITPIFEKHNSVNITLDYREEKPNRRRKQ